ncbi:MAG TPA: DUF1501 domain-containing protein [Tepidisphaeraceae bacterium]|nr:DUF1501 domain-containing protein [Tepidisphaeraceae bacterium]
MFDVSLTRSKSRLCTGASRRDFLRIGALGAFGLSLPSVLARAASPTGSGTSAPPNQSKPRAKAVLLVFLGGGLSHHDTFDMKPDQPEEIRGKYKSIPTNVTGLHVGELLPKMARTMDKVCLVRSQSHENDHHETAQNWVLSGRFGSPFGDYPSMGAVVAHQTGFGHVLPPYVAIPKNSAFTWELGKSAFLGGRYESFKAGDPNQPNYRVRDLGLADGMTPKSDDRRRSLLAAVDRLSETVQGNDQLATYDQFQKKAAEIVLSKHAQSAFDIGAEKDALRDDYGRTEIGQSCLLARRLVERGVKFVQVNHGGWDHHAKIWTGLEKKVPAFDQAFSALINDMHASGLLAETLVVVMGEFGRTPKVNKDVGRDHWGRAGSMLFAGAGVTGGKVLGATDKTGANVTDRPVRPADVAYTIYDALGIDPRKQIHTPDGRPLEILAEGATVRELYS